MAKNSNKKNKRQKAERKAVHKYEAKLAKTRVNPFDQELITERKLRLDYFRHLRNAWENPNYYSYLSWNLTSDRHDECPQDAIDFSNMVLHYKITGNEKRVLGRLLETLRRTKIIENGDNENMKYLEALLNISKYQWLWRRNPTEWKPTVTGKEQMFSEFLRYLFAKYDVPRFLDKAWLSEGEDADQFKTWFFAIGDGVNIRKQSGLPIPLTKKMAHEFLQAPARLSVKAAFRWAQLKSMGADNRTIGGVLSTPLAECFDNDEFWVSVLRLFIDDPFLEPSNYGPIYDYLHNQKFVSRGRRWIDGDLVDLGPEQPNLSMKGRDSITLLAQVNRWHNTINRMSYSSIDENWGSCGLPGFEMKDKDCYYQISEILNSRDLQDEGADMHHCIASYVRYCVRGETAMYSLTSTTEAGTEREVSIEVKVDTKTIVQARKRYNAVPTGNDMRVIGAWAKKAGITVSRWLKEY